MPRVAYLVMSYLGPVERLIATLRAGSPDAVIAVHHDPRVRPLGEVDAIRIEPRPIAWGHGSQLLAVLHGLRVLRDRADWFVLLSGQDYPVRSLAEIEAGLHGADAFIQPTPPATRRCARPPGSSVCFLDDDVEVWPGWLDALVAHEADEAFGGPIRPRLEGSHLRACGREPLPVTALDLGEQDRTAEFVWGANMAIRRAAFERIGPFDEALGGAGDEEDWQRRLLVRPAGASATSRRRASIIAAPAVTRTCATWPAPPTTAAAQRGATASSAATPRRCSRSCER